MQDEFAWIWLDRDWSVTSWDDVLGTWKSHTVGLHEGEVTAAGVEEEIKGRGIVREELTRLWFRKKYVI